MKRDKFSEHKIRNLSPQNKILADDPLLAEGLALGAEISVIEPHNPARRILEGEVLTFTQKTAAWYFDTLMLNVFPQPIRRKSGFPWKILQYTRLHRDNESYGLMPVFSGQCNIAVMVGATSRNLFVLDCEEDTLFGWVIRQLEFRQIPIWAVKSARGGHLWMLSSEGVVKSISSAEMAKHNLKIEIRGHTGYVLAPCSVHPKGKVYDWISRQGEDVPSVDINSIDFLPIKLELHKPEKKLSHTRGYNPLSKATQDYLLNGHRLPEGQRHNGFYNALKNYAQCGYGASEMYRDLVPVARSSGLPDKDDPHYFDRQISLVVRNVAPRYHNAPRLLDWQRAATFIENHLWKGRTGSTDRRVALALVERAKTYSNENGTFRASLREIGGIARITDRRTISNALERLKTIPFICYAGEDKTSRATIWRFSNKALAMQFHRGEITPLNLNTLEFLSNGVISLSSDASERGALGHSGMQVWQALLAHGKPTFPTMIAKISGLTLNQVKYVLNPNGWLRKSNLVVRTKSGWIAQPATAEQLNESVARPAGTLGKGEARRQRHKDERAIQAGQVIMKARFEYDSQNLAA